MNETYDRLEATRRYLRDISRTMGHSGLLRDVRAALRYDNELEASAAGKDFLRQREFAYYYLQQGRHADARREFEIALENVPQNEKLVVGAAQHALAECLVHDSTGYTLENLFRAETYFRLAVANKARRKHPFAIAQSESALAQCLARLAAIARSHDERKRRMSEAIELAQSAAKRTREIGGIYGAIQEAGHLGTLGRCLSEIADWSRAIGVLQRAERLIETMSPEARSLPEIIEVWPKIRFHLAQALLSSERVNGHVQGECIAKELIEHGIDDTERLRIVLAQHYMLQASTETCGLVVELLKPLPSLKMPIRDRIARAELLYASGAVEDAVDAFRTVIDALASKRFQSIGDHEADEHSEWAQHAAAILARIEVSRGNDIEAFCVLERDSGRRFNESLGWHLALPTEPVAGKAFVEYLKYAADAVALAHVVRGLVDRPDEARSSFLRDLVRDFRSQAGQTTSIGAEIERALDHADPLGALAGAAQCANNACMSLLKEALDRDEKYRDDFETLHAPTTRERLIGLLAEYPGLVLLRVSVKVENVLAIGVWYEAGELRGAHASCALDVERIKRLDEIIAGRDPVEAHANVLESLDISSAFPANAFQTCVFLPSIHAARLPLAAMGPLGRTALDRFREILWMPSIAPLVLRRQPWSVRSGTALVVPGHHPTDPTRFHGYALRDATEDQQLIGPQATVTNAVEAVSSAAVFRFYGHGRHAMGGPQLVLWNGPLDLGHRTHEWNGLNRAELWACESGVDVPYDPLGIQIDEGYGFDIEMLKAGVLGTIGTLREVHEIVAVCILIQYRRNLEHSPSAPAALAQAQRWWRDTGQRELLESLKNGDVAEAKQFLDRLGDSIADVANDAFADTSELQRLAQLVSSPVAFGAYRFCGVPENLAIVAAPVDEMPGTITDEEAAEIERVLRNARAVAHRHSDIR